jgi:glycine betaine/proline transport system substrate-binding protein
MAYVIGGIFESMGNNVEYKFADSQAVYEAIRIGDITISHEVWQPNFVSHLITQLQKAD